MPAAPRKASAKAAPRPGFAVIGVGSSAGGLEACGKLLDAVPPDFGMAFILVQHLDPNHKSMMAELLAHHTTMRVVEAGDGMAVEPGNFYIIPPGTYLSVEDGMLRVSPPLAPHGSRLPFDHLLVSLAHDYGRRAACVVLSGTGGDGSTGLKAIKEAGGLIIAQTPEQAEYDGMPRSAMATGLVDMVLDVAAIPAALAKYSRRIGLADTAADGAPEGAAHWLNEIIELVRAKTAHDFSLYKPGTLQRRTERRLAMAAIEPDGMDRYIELLKRDEKELEALSKDLLINVTSFFRDTKVFDELEHNIIPALVKQKAAGETLRVWIAGCSSGEETYSLAMLLREAIAVAHCDIKLQIFASDLDLDSVNLAREGVYPEAAVAEISPARLKRFFSHEEHGYRIVPELRNAVVFTRQDVLGDPPFSRLDLISCRNLLIYLQPEAQARVIGIFHFALRQGGVLLLGSAETVSNSDGRFAVISKAGRIFRKTGAGSAVSLALPPAGSAPAQRSRTSHKPSRAAALADLCRQLVVENHAPAAVLVNARHECLFHLGPTDRFLRIAPGLPANDVLAMARDGVRTKLRSAIGMAQEKHVRVEVGGGHVLDAGVRAGFRIIAEPVTSDGEALVFVAFVDEDIPAARRHAVPPRDQSRVAELEAELAETREELHGAIHNLEISGEEQKAINEEALSVNEEFQATNEEMLASKEELQSLNEELTALNSQLQETLERQRTTSNDLQNVLFSTDVATLFLDPKLHIRFFTPATKLLFSVIDSDVGRPLSDLSSLAADSALPADARTVLKTGNPIEREIEARTGAWYMRRIMPYRAQDGSVEGVVITFVDITERREISEALEAAKRVAQLATIAKSRFLAAASHDLRQPLQTLTLLHGLLARVVTGTQATRLVARLDETLGAMSGMLNALLDINRIEAGNVQTEKLAFPINDLLDRMRTEFGYTARAKGIDLRVVPSALQVYSDPALLDQMVRNLLSNALKYTQRGKVLVGCRRSHGEVRIEIWDTGIGIPEAELQAIFEEYHQLDNEARERSRGLGLGLSIVKRLGVLLGHKVSVRSAAGSGSMFGVAVEVPPITAQQVAAPSEPEAPVAIASVAGTILIVDDDPEILDLLDLILTDEGFHTLTAANADAALEKVARLGVEPNLILADYNLPGGIDGLQLVTQLRGRVGRLIPAIILTGDISTRSLRDITQHNCVQLSKPVKLPALSRIIADLLAPATLPVLTPRPVAASDGLIFVIDDDEAVRAALCALLEDHGWLTRGFASAEEFLADYGGIDFRASSGDGGCLLVDVRLPGLGGLELLRVLTARGDTLPAIMITGHSDVGIAVEAMKAGACDFIVKPVRGAALIASVAAVFDSRKPVMLDALQTAAAALLAKLTSRQREVMDRVLAGQPSKNIAADLGLSQRTVETHRAAIMKKTGAKSLPGLVRLVLAAAAPEVIKKVL